MKSIEIVTHCWRYWRCLTYQVSALYLHPPGETLDVILHVLLSDEDAPTSNRTEQLMQIDWPNNVRLKVTHLPKEQLFRRSIGRNLLALQTRADIVWFTDCDYLIHGTSLYDVFHQMGQADIRFIYPGQIMGTTHEVGDQIIQQATDWTGPIKADRSLITEVLPMNRAIGGIQIVDGDLCREYGYLKDSKKAQCLSLIHI